MNKVVLNIGGKLFTTYKKTLEGIPYFDAILNRFNCKIEDGTYYPEMIDRCPSAFKRILRYLRDNSYKIPNEYFADLDYYGIEYNIPKDTISENIHTAITTEHYLKYFSKNSDLYPINDCNKHIVCVEKKHVTYKHPKILLHGDAVMNMYIWVTHDTYNDVEYIDIIYGCIILQHISKYMLDQYTKLHNINTTGNIKLLKVPLLHCSDKHANTPDILYNIHDISVSIKSIYYDTVDHIGIIYDSIKYSDYDSDYLKHNLINQNIAIWKPILDNTPCYNKDIIVRISDATNITELMVSITTSKGSLKIKYIKIIGNDSVLYKISSYEIEAYMSQAGYNINDNIYLVDLHNQCIIPNNYESFYIKITTDNPKVGNNYYLPILYYKTYATFDTKNWILA